MTAAREDWRALARRRANEPPARPRVPLLAGAVRIGSVEPGLLRPLRVEGLRETSGAWIVDGDLTSTLARVAFALRDAGIAHAWRDEQLAVRGEDGQVLGTIERAVVRPLGIPTAAVHLAGRSADGRHWVQQRSFTKPNDPGLWDTLMGGMVPASDSLQQALERETWEEAGLRVADLEALTHRGRIETRRPTDAGRDGYVVEWIDWFTCTVPSRLVPANQDGEVERFELIDQPELLARLQRDEFTLEAALIFDGIVDAAH